MRFMRNFATHVLKTTCIGNITIDFPYSHTAFRTNLTLLPPTIVVAAESMYRCTCVPMLIKLPKQGTTTLPAANVAIVSSRQRFNKEATRQPTRIATYADLFYSYENNRLLRELPRAPAGMHGSRAFPQGQCVNRHNAF